MLNRLTTTTGSFDWGVAVDGVTTLIVKQSSLEGNTALKIELVIKFTASAVRPVRIGNLIACWGQAAPKEVTVSLLFAL